MRLKAISLYTGAGGLDLGLESAGFETLAAVEMDPDCVKTLRSNRDWPILDRSIHAVPSSELLATARLDPGEADLLFGGPPCQPFSKAGYWASGDSRRLDDPRADTVAAFLRVLRDTRPRAFLMENVAGLAFRGKDEGLRLIQQTAVQRQVGNAVPSALAEMLGLAIRARLLGDASVSDLTPTLLPNRGNSIPPSEPVAPVPEKYLHLVGDHEAHPGTGKGYGAVARAASRGSKP